MITHFAGDYFHYDNKFWITLKTLFTKPGLATLEYNAGKRAKYLNPIQLYIFVTTVFFVFGMPSKNNHETKAPITVNYIQDSTLKTPPKGLKGLYMSGGNTQIGIGEWAPKENTIEEYDSVQHSLPAKERDSFWLRHIRHKSYLHTENLGEQFSHNFSKIFFILLPFFALLLALLFRNKKQYYVDHIIFSIHFHSFVFILFILDAIILKTFKNNLLNAIVILINFIGIGFYLFKALKNVYPTHSFKLFAKQVLMFMIYFFGFILSMSALLILLFLFF